MTRAPLAGVALLGCCLLWAGAASAQATSATAQAASDDQPVVKDAVPAPVKALAPASPTVAEWIGRSFSVPQETEIVAAPSEGAASAGRLMQGAEVDVVGIIEGGEWLQVHLPDGSTGYVRTASIPSVTSGPAKTATAPAAPNAPASTASASSESATGPAQGYGQVHDTGLLVVNSRPIPLYGIDGFGGEPARAMQAFLETKVGLVMCKPVESEAFSCTLPDGTDLAKAALVNGAARVVPDAPADYVAQEENAKQFKRGIWRDGGAKVDAVPLSKAATASGPGDNSYVPGVVFAGPDGPPAEFIAASPIDGLAFIADQPFTLDESMPTPILYVPAVGWGFWDRYFVWRQAPASWIGRLEQSHPHGTALRKINLEQHGYVLHTAYFRGPAVNASFVPGLAPVVVDSSPYPPPAFELVVPSDQYAPYGFAPDPVGPGLVGFAPGLRPGPGGFGPGGPGPRGFGPGGFGPGGFGPRGPGFGPGGMRPGPGGFGPGMGGPPHAGFPGGGMRPGPGGFGPGGLGPGGGRAGFPGGGMRPGGPGGFAGGPGGGPRGGFPGGPMGGMAGGPGRFGGAGPGAFGARPVPGPGMMGGRPGFAGGGGGGFARAGGFARPGGFGGGGPGFSPRPMGGGMAPHMAMPAAAAHAAAPQNVGRRH